MPTVYRLSSSQRIPILNKKRRPWKRDAEESRSSLSPFQTREAWPFPVTPNARRTIRLVRAQVR
jgi:hypothetical protein